LKKNPPDTEAEGTYLTLIAPSDFSPRALNPADTI